MAKDKLSQERLAGAVIGFTSPLPFQPHLIVWQSLGMF